MFVFCVHPRSLFGTSIACPYALIMSESVSDGPAVGETKPGILCSLLFSPDWEGQCLLSLGHAVSVQSVQLLRASQRVSPRSS